MPRFRRSPALMWGGKTREKKNDVLGADPLITTQQHTLPHALFDISDDAFVVATRQLCKTLDQAPVEDSDRSLHSTATTTRPSRVTLPHHEVKWPTLRSTSITPESIRVCSTTYGSRSPLQASVWLDMS